MQTIVMSGENTPTVSINDGTSDAMTPTTTTTSSNGVIFTSETPVEQGDDNSTAIIVGSVVGVCCW
jgi:hypothetical protein